MRHRLILAASSLLLYLALANVSAARSADLSFKEISGEESGLGKIMKDWKEREFKLQNGKFGSHGWWTWGLTAFDIDNDGDIDLIPSHHGKPGGLILKSDFSQTGKMTFKDVTAEMGVEARKMPGADKKCTVWDFDGDGFLDIAGWTDEGKAPCYFNVAGRKLVKIEGHTFSPVSHPGYNTVRDLNGDGYLDYAGHHRGKSFFRVYDPEGRTFREFEDKKPKPKINVPQEFLDSFAELKKLKKVTKRHPKGYLINRFLRVTYLTEYDLDLDGKKDLIAKCSTAYGVHLPAAFFLGDGTGNYVDKTEELGLPKEGCPALIKDVTADGLPDIFMVRKSGAGLYMATKEGTFVKPENVELTAMLKEGGSYIQTIWPVDLDNDSDLDLVISVPREGREEIYENKGAGTFKLILKFSGWDSEPIAICDLNNDGLIDIAVGGSGTTGKRSSKANADITMFINQTRTENRYCNIYPRMDKPNPYAVGTRLTVYPAGKLGTDGAVPIVDEYAHQDASPVHVGLGKATSFDLKIAFPNGKKHELKNITAANRMKVTPDGKMVKMD